MESVKRSKERMKKFPILVAQCHKQGSAYAACVISKRNLKKDDCIKEFESFRNCLAKAAVQHNTKI
ncbi:unnamed protein product [Trichogramma brassicae]|uniref:IMS import disulfide relay-system CHCH-CHCH-like Cx9C domain-containing protein n=1 Tax=Trichogramma brassicae TaxID=86971 RepID=A0A6H5J5R1_9HYME|nr:NADH dehydrogenase [ubiquinone] 1 alpha subcomplex assembly factor 8 [Trichogramma pretiosum]CAB0045088.1 unnamed protein product [Trichogramma brassicae]